MPLPTVISDISPIPGTGAAPNAGQPGGGENPSTFDDYLRLYAAFIAQLRAGGGLAASGANRIPFFDAAGALTSAADFVRDASGYFLFNKTSRGTIVAGVRMETEGRYASTATGVSGYSFGVQGSNFIIGDITDGTNEFVRMAVDASGHQINTPGNTTPPTLTVNGQFTLTPTSNTNFRISYRGTDGVTRIGNITLA